ncbi:MAG: cyclic nucleotide-binding domain-containing protein [Rhodospirillales bacterium]|nr:cyclic nucleotide-binding domain-containing protein [Rhodospirillales bacterium]
MTVTTATEPIVYTFEPGQVIFSEGDPAKSLLLIEEGLVEIARTIDGQRKVLQTLGTGGVFGEMALLNHTTRAATATAVERTSLIIVPRFVLEKQMARADALVRKLIYALIASRAGPPKKAGDPENPKKSPAG